MQNDADILDEIKQAVNSVDKDAEVILFGSRARGDYNDESDWDVLVLVNREQEDWRFRREIRHAVYKVELELGIIISTIVRNKQFWNDISVTPLYREIEKDGITL